MIPPTFLIAGLSLAAGMVGGFKLSGEVQGIHIVLKTSVCTAAAILFAREFGIIK